MENMGRDMDKLYAWRKDKIKRYEFTINKETDADIYEHMEEIENKRQYLISLIRKDIKRLNKKK